MVIREYHKSRGDTHRNVCLIPSSMEQILHLKMAGMKVIVTPCDDNGNIDVAPRRKSKTF